jgi:predicted transcriptional regulator
MARTSQPAIARLEAGRLSPSVATLARLMDALGLRLEMSTPEADSGIDQTLVAQMLRLSPQQRLRKLAQEVTAIDRLRRAGVKRGSG